MANDNEIVQESSFLELWLNSDAEKRVRLESILDNVITGILPAPPCYNPVFSSDVHLTDVQSMEEIQAAPLDGRKEYYAKDVDGNILGFARISRYWGDVWCFRADGNKYKQMLKCMDEKSREALPEPEILQRVKELIAEWWRSNGDAVFGVIMHPPMSE